MFRYVAERFVVVDRQGRTMALRWCGVRPAGDQLLICLRTSATASLAGARVRNTLLTEWLADQVNIVQATYGGRRQTLLFTPGTGAKLLP